MRNITWQYVAGFFDGEGCVWWCVGRRGPQASMSQVLPEVLYDIRDFLAEYGIVANLRRQSYSAGSFKSSAEKTKSLEIQGEINCIKFLSFIAPYLHTKKRIYAYDILRFHTAYPPISDQQRTRLSHESRWKKKRELYR